jgi:hypothetical protein
VANGLSFDRNPSHALLMPAPAKPNPTWALCKLCSCRPADRPAASLAARMDRTAKVKSEQMFAGPLQPSPSRFPCISRMRARQTLPPPSMPMNNCLDMYSMGRKLPHKRWHKDKPKMALLSRARGDRGATTCGGGVRSPLHSARNPRCPDGDSCWIDCHHVGAVPGAKLAEHVS